jgi:hypothetical protein
MTHVHVEYLAHHWIVLAVPAFLPAIIVVAVVLYVALWDRRSGGKPDDAGQRTDAPTGHILAVIAAHDKALRVLPAGHQLTGQLTMMLVMVGYTYLLFGG